MAAAGYGVRMRCAMAAAGYGVRKRCAMAAAGYGVRKRDAPWPPPADLLRILAMDAGKEVVGRKGCRQRKGGWMALGGGGAAAAIWIGES